MRSLGTSGVFFVATDGFLANPAQGVHSFCHALPHTWHLMSVMLSAAACVDHTQRLTGAADVRSLLAAAERRGFSDTTPHYLPYLNGERTPHNNPAAKAVFFGLDAGTDAAARHRPDHSRGGAACRLHDAAVHVRRVQTPVGHHAGSVSGGPRRAQRSMMSQARTRD